MPDTTIRQGDLPTGWTDLYARVETDTGAIWNGSAYVAFVVADLATYRVPMTESPAGSGRYSVAFPGSPAGNYTWSIYKGLGILADPRWGGPTTAFWDGTQFVAGGGDLVAIQEGVAGITATLDSYAELSPAAVVTDPSPTAGGFIIALADGSPVPSTFVWRNSEAWFNGTGVLSGGKYPVATYTKLTATTARITFSPLLPLTPANGDTLLLG